MAEVKTTTTDSVFLMMYLLYKANMLTKNHLKHMLKIVKEDSPVDIAKFLVEEAGRAY